MKLDLNNGFDLVIIGAGANISHFFRNLLQDLANYGEKFKNNRILIADGDKVEEKNIKNQLYTKEDVGAFKVHALAERYGGHYGIDVLAANEYITNLDALDSLFSKTGKRQKVLIGGVDNNRTRQLMHEYFCMVDDLIYIDLGVEGVILREELNEIADNNVRERMIIGSGFSGQVVTGYKTAGQVFLQPVAELYPTILTDEESVFPTQACVETLNNPQRVETNKMCAQLANIILNNLFHTGEIHQSEITFNARYGQSNAKFIDKRIERAYKEFLQSKEIKIAN